MSKEREKNNFTILTGYFALILHFKPLNPEAIRLLHRKKRSSLTNLANHTLIFAEND